MSRKARKVADDAQDVDRAKFRLQLCVEAIRGTFPNASCAAEQERYLTALRQLERTFLLLRLPTDADIEAACQAKKDSP